MLWVGRSYIHKFLTGTSSSSRKDWYSQGLLHHGQRGMVSSAKAEGAVPQRTLRRSSAAMMYSPTAELLKCPWPHGELDLSGSCTVSPQLWLSCRNCPTSVTALMNSLSLCVPPPPAPPAPVVPSELRGCVTCAPPSVAHPWSL